MHTWWLSKIISSFLLLSFFYGNHFSRSKYCAEKVVQRECALLGGGNLCVLLRTAIEFIYFNAYLCHRHWAQERTHVWDAHDNRGAGGLLVDVGRVRRHVANILQRQHEARGRLQDCHLQIDRLFFHLFISVFVVGHRDQCV